MKYRASLRVKPRRRGTLPKGRESLSTGRDHAIVYWHPPQVRRRMYPPGFWNHTTQEVGCFLDYFGRKPSQFLGITAAHMCDKLFGRLVRFFVCWRRVKRGPLGATTLKDCAVE